MKLAVLLSGFPRRSETFALNEVLALREAGCLAAVFATKGGEPGPRQPAAEALMDTVHVLAPGTPEEQAAEVAARLEGEDVTAVHGYFAHLPAEVARTAARRLGVPHGFSVHALDARRAGRDGLARRGRDAACVVACNPDVAAEVRDAGVRVALIPHGVDLDRFPAAPPAPEDGTLRLLAVGRLVAKKGFDTLVDAVALATAPVHLRIVGAGPEHDALAERIAARGVQDRVELAGTRTHDTLRAEYAAAHAVAVPCVQDAAGDRDGLPNVVLEAMASGRAIVASRIAAVGSAISDGDTGLLVTPGDPADLARALDDLAAPARPGGPARRRARARVERDFDLRACTDRLRAHLETAYA